ncbi:nucleolar rnase [Colletotrichum truncatum]|uniref:Nucleolar rnase n=1 Tax=Colletotrichum truncatum TaxID=5467 RepID=A0ACC3ZA94_COLTU|nr:nucleolar rnase [Colletotrichum truncatum]KAF6796148.1 nucleolar rnase [Colletotrichum truncatum]
MSKRSSSGGLPPSKRRQMGQDSLDLLLSHSDELIQCLQALTNSSKRECEALQNLRGLSKTLLPAFKYLAGEEPSPSEPERLETEEKTTNNVVHSGPPIPSFTFLKPWTSADIATSLPPLPQINNPVLETAAFTHQGMVKNKGDLSYDRLEWLGDAYVELFSTCLIFQTFGGMPTGKCAQLRELLVRNANIGEYATKYGLLERAILPPEYDPNSQVRIKAKPQEVKKVRGDLFEAYVAAVILSDPANGLSRAAEWLRALWSRTIQDQIRAADKKPDVRMVKELGTTSEPAEVVTIAPKVRLSQTIGAKGIQIRYEDMPNGNKKDKYNNKLALFTVGVYLDGWGETNKLLGTGSDLNKKEAGQKAAQVALNNKKLMKVYQEKKAAMYAALGESMETTPNA